MQRLAEVAQRLREVREAHERFLALYAVEVALVEPGVEQIAADISGVHGGEDDPDVPHWQSERHDGHNPLGWQ
jgi:hypothetical protein